MAADVVDVASAESEQGFYSLMIGIRLGHLCT